MTYSIYNILYHHLCNNTLRKYIKLCQLEMYFIIAINLVNVTHHSQRIAPWVCFFFLEEECVTWYIEIAIFIFIFAKYYRQFIIFCSPTTLTFILEVTWELGFFFYTSEPWVASISLFFFFFWEKLLQYYLEMKICVGQLTAHTWGINN